MQVRWAALHILVHSAALLSSNLFIFFFNPKSHIFFSVESNPCLPENVRVRPHGFHIMEPHMILDGFCPELCLCEKYSASHFTQKVDSIKLEWILCYVGAPALPEYPPRIKSPVILFHVKFTTVYSIPRVSLSSIFYHLMNYQNSENFIHQNNVWVTDLFI